MFVKSDAGNGTNGTQGTNGTSAAGGVAYSKYKRLGGEVEARNAVRRMKMSPEEKKRRLLAETADVAEGDRIFIEDAFASSTEMRDERGERKEEEKGIRFSLPEDRFAFQQSLDEYQVGTLDRMVPVQVTSETPPLYLRLNLSDKGLRVHNRKITMPYSVIEKAVGVRASTSTGEGHNLDIETLKKLPDSLYAPVMILDSNTEKSLEIYTELFDMDGKPVMVALLLDAQEKIGGKRTKEYVVNSIRSVYGKDNANTPINRLMSGHGRYVNMKKAANWSRAAGVQFPSAGAIKSSSPYTIIEDSEKSSGENENVRFSVSQTERTDNGLERTQTDSEEFKRWFEDSQAVDDDGKPLVVYRRDNADFSVFDIDETQKTDAGFLGKGFYFYGDKTEAEGAGAGYGKNLRAFYLKAENPYFISQEEVNELAEANDKTKSAEFVERLKEEGYDSVYWNGDLRQEWVVFEPTQIKSATDNIGTFDGGNPDVRFSREDTGAGVSDESKVQAWAEVLLPVYGKGKIRTVKGAEKYLEEHGIEVGEEDRILLEAACSRVEVLRSEHTRRNAAAKAAASRKAGWKWIYENNQLYHDIVDFAGTEDFKIRPAERFKGQIFSGSFIAPEWIKYSGKGESIAGEKAMNNAKGLHSNELAKAIARKTGRDPLDVEQEIIE